MENLTMRNCLLKLQWRQKPTGNALGFYTAQGAVLLEAKPSGIPVRELPVLRVSV